ncbi:Putative NADPH-quinone reductase [Hyphomicrobiales bacterium]|nr:Putative NADPH-quinone reductase [Hyphomicrobiales bacterium]CAH1674388.1 putative NADPH-quinone reductase [Hyphomicrobiales bacterium]
MSRRIVIIQGHPDPDEQRLCRALADAYIEGAREAGHDINSIDLASLEIPFLRSQSSFENDPVPPSLKPAQEAILAAEHIVIVFPLWLGTMPALVKAFLEQVMRPGFAFGYDKGVPKTKLAGRSARLVVTMSMPVMAYRWWYFGHGLKALQHNILRFVGISPVRESLFGMVVGVNDATRRKWLDDMRKLGRQGA